MFIVSIELRPCFESACCVDNVLYNSHNGAMIISNIRLDDPKARIFKSRAGARSFIRKFERKFNIDLSNKLYIVEVPK